MEKSIIEKTKYPPESAGRRMVESVPLAHPDEKILDVKQRLFEKMNTFETVNYIYVVNKTNKLVGVFSIKEIFSSPATKKVNEIMKTETIKARPHTDQERVALLALKNNLKSIPVVDKDENFLGTVPSDTILEILHSEHIEDILRSAGVHKDSYSPEAVLKAPISILAKRRLPWLFLGLFGGIFAARIVELFENSLESHFVLAAFIPLMVYMADAVGVQTQTLFIRSLTMDQNLNVKRYLNREIQTSLFIAFVLGILLFLFASLWLGIPSVGLILGISLCLTVIFASLIGILIPCLLHNLKKDPAIGSGPFATIVRDILSLLIYFSTAFLLLRFF